MTSTLRQQLNKYISEVPYIGEALVSDVNFSTLRNIALATTLLFPGMSYAKLPASPQQSPALPSSEKMQCPPCPPCESKTPSKGSSATTPSSSPARKCLDVEDLVLDMYPSFSQQLSQSKVPGLLDSLKQFLLNDAGYHSLIPMGEKSHAKSYMRMEHIPDAQEQFYSRSQKDANLLNTQMRNIRGSFRLQAFTKDGSLLQTATFKYIELQALTLGDKGVRQRFAEKVLPSCKRK